MEQLAEKAQFLKSEYAKKLDALDANAERKWGKMNVQQMIEHMSEYVRVGCGKDMLPLQTPEEHLPKYQEFLKTEKPFRENTPNSLMSDIPAKLKHSSKEAAIEELRAELNNFFETFKNEPDKKVINPFFGELNYDMSVQLLHKHAWHHLRQFGVDS
ncbi:MAG: DinB family protein [Bacteroidetes bacterium]|nr:DinB family protein [Bacteroidota bacterium]